MEWQIRLGNSFEKGLQNFFDKNYKNNKNGIESFNDELSNIIKNLIQDPRCLASALEPCPHKSCNPEFEFRKYRFNAPLLSGSAKKARLDYLLDLKEKRIILITIYTHKQEKGRPDDTKLRNLIKNETE